MKAERTLTLDAKTPLTISVEIAFPVQQKDGEFGCAFSIAWPDGPRSGTAYGHDGIQALLLAMNMVAANLYTSDFHKDGQLLWEKKANGYGFPLGLVLKELAQGDDKFI